MTEDEIIKLLKQADKTAGGGCSGQGEFPGYSPPGRSQEYDKFGRSPRGSRRAHGCPEHFGSYV